MQTYFQNYSLSGEYLDIGYYFGYILYALGFLLIKENAQDTLSKMNNYKVKKAKKHD